MAGGMGGILDFSSESTSWSSTVNTVNTDSNNRSNVNTTTMDNTGNMTLNLGGGGVGDTLKAILPYAVLGVVGLALLRFGGGGRSGSA